MDGIRVVVVVDVEQQETVASDRGPMAWGGILAAMVNIGELLLNGIMAKLHNRLNSRATPAHPPLTLPKKKNVVLKWQILVNGNGLIINGNGSARKNQRRRDQEINLLLMQDK